MIDWAGLVYNGLWVLGAGVVLAALSYANWLAHSRGERLRMVLDRRIFQFPFNAGMGLIGLSLALLSRSWWERALWSVLTLGWAWFAWSAWRGRTAG